MDVNTCLKIQLGALYGLPGRDMKIIIPDIQKQRGTNDCGLFAIANAVEFCTPNLHCGLTPMSFEDGPMCMRDHLRKCFEARWIEPFPSIVHRRKIKVRDLLIQSCCPCRLPNIMAKLVSCNTCNLLWHETCILTEDDMTVKCPICRALQV